MIIAGAVLQIFNPSAAWYYDVDNLPGKWSNHNNKIWLKSHNLVPIIGTVLSKRTEKPIFIEDYYCVLVNTGHLYWLSASSLFGLE